MDKISFNVQTGEVTALPYTEEEKAQRAAQHTARAWEKLRDRRNTLLIESDACVLPDRWDSYSDERRAAWASYRQVLRDLPETTQDPFNPMWPSKPE